ncbi:hypothetical protein HYU93_05125 [Candidatus Daviesbacteria bacterium]|nr:hypothetical protein [Candidatus Daviesbacteria bacterium]
MVYGISTGEGYKTYYGYSLLDEDKDKHLSESVRTLKRLAYDEGIYIDPLKREIANKIREWKLDPKQIAAIVREALVLRGQKGDVFDASTRGEPKPVYY